MSELAQALAAFAAVAAAAGFLTYRVLQRRRGHCGNCGRCERALGPDGAPVAGGGACKREGGGLRSPALKVLQR